MAGIAWIVSLISRKSPSLLLTSHASEQKNRQRSPSRQAENHMFQKRSPQSSMFESSNLVSHKKAERLATSWVELFHTYDERPHSIFEGDRTPMEMYSRMMAA
jgi:hypothetical protein